MFENFDANNLKFRDLLVLVGIPVILIAAVLFLGNISILLPQILLTFIVGIFLTICGGVILKRKRTESGNYTNTYVGESGGILGLIFLVLLLLTPFLKNKNGTQAKMVGYLFIIIGVIALGWSLIYGIPEIIRIIS